MFNYRWIIEVVSKALTLPIECVDFVVVLRVERFDWKVTDRGIANCMDLHFAQYLVIDV